MICKRTAIWKREEYSYESEERDIPYVISYMHEDGQIRPAMIVVPGGAYRQVSSSEGDGNVFIHACRIRGDRCGHSSV